MKMRRAERIKDGSRHAPLIALWGVLLLLMGLVLAVCWPSGIPAAPATHLYLLTPSPPPSPTSTPAPTLIPTTTATPTPTPTPVPELILSFIGDCTLGGDVRNGQYDAFRRTLEANGGDYGYFFSGASQYLLEDDFTLANLEGPLTSQETGDDKQFVFRGDPEYANILSQGGVEAVSLANNHAQDYGTAGYIDSLAALDIAGILAADVRRPVLYPVGDYTIGVAALKFPTDSRLKQLSEDIETLRGQGCDIIIAAMHWNEEGNPAPLPEGIRAGHFAIDAGADAVIGHHPHILQGIELYKGKLIVHSLGNFVFGGNRSPDERETAVFQLRFTIDGGTALQSAYRLLPYAVSGGTRGNDYRPVELSGEDAQRVYDLINNRGELLPAHVTVKDGWLPLDAPP